MSLAYLGLGSNLGDRSGHIRKAVAQIEERGLGTVLRQSKLYETEPVDCAEGGAFINCAIEIMTDLEPHTLLKGLHAVEAELGRVRKPDQKNAPRTLDIDILLYDFIVLNEKGLVLPHPWILDRLFVLKPLLDIRPELFHPLAQKSIAEIYVEAPAEVLNQKIREL
ncbi:MAG: 2-amino-4-hydroxy-6-hydroxymethyldihydropteridine diphosphokinase [Fibrobacterota bacterium]